MLNAELFNVLIKDTTEVLNETPRLNDLTYAQYGNKEIPYTAPQTKAASWLLPNAIDKNFFKLFGTATGILLKQIKYIGVKLSETNDKKSEMLFFNANFHPVFYNEIKNKGYRTLVVADDGSCGELKDNKFVSLIKESINISSKRVLVDAVYEKLKVENGIDSRRIIIVYFFVDSTIT